MIPDHYVSGPNRVCSTSSHKEFGEDGEFQNEMSLVSLLILNLIVDVQRNKFFRVLGSSFLVSILILLCRLIF